MSRGLLFFAVLFMSTAASASPGVYKWVDRHGQVHYDDTSVLDGVRLTRELLATRTVAPAPESGFTVPAEWVEWMARQCDFARSRVNTLQVATAVYGLAPSGHEFQYSDQQVRLMLLENRALETRHCARDAARDAYRAALLEVETQPTQRAP